MRPVIIKKINGFLNIYKFLCIYTTGNVAHIHTAIYFLLHLDLPLGIYAPLRRMLLAIGRTNTLSFK